MSAVKPLDWTTFKRDPHPYLEAKCPILGTFGVEHTESGWLGFCEDKLVSSAGSKLVSRDGLRETDIGHRHSLTAQIGCQRWRQRQIQRVLIEDITPDPTMTSLDRQPPALRRATYLAMNMSWERPGPDNNFCWVCRTPLIRYWISDEDGLAHLGCEYLYTVVDNGELAQYHDTRFENAISLARRHAARHYAKMIYPDAEMGRWLFGELGRGNMEDRW